MFNISPLRTSQYNDTIVGIQYLNIVHGNSMVVQFY